MIRVKFVKIVGTSLKKGTVTIKYPYEKPLITSEFRGKIEVDPAKCTGCGACTRICPPKALYLVKEGDNLVIRYFIGRCIFCAMCADTCPQKAISVSHEFELATDDIASLYEDIEHDLVKCACGKAFAPKKLVNEAIEKTKLPPHLLTLCPECRRVETVKRLSFRLLGVKW